VTIQCGASMLHISFTSHYYSNAVMIHLGAS